MYSSTVVVICTCIVLVDCLQCFLCFFFCLYFFFQAEDGIRDLVRSRGLGDVYKRQCFPMPTSTTADACPCSSARASRARSTQRPRRATCCLLYTSDAADERSSVDLGGRRIIKKKTTVIIRTVVPTYSTTRNTHITNSSTHETKYKNVMTK